VSATASAIEYQSFRSSYAMSAFRGAEMRAKRFIRRKTSCVHVSVLGASPVRRHLEHGGPQGPDHPRRPHFRRGTRRGRSPPDYEEPQARRHPVCPALLGQRWKVPWDPGPPTSSRSCSATARLRESAKALSSAPPSDRSAVVSGRSGPADFNEKLHVL
jgi:hypothetical protein